MIGSVQPKVRIRIIDREKKGRISGLREIGLGPCYVLHDAFRRPPQSLIEG